MFVLGGWGEQQGGASGSVGEGPLDEGGYIVTSTFLACPHTHTHARTRNQVRGAGGCSILNSHESETIDVNNRVWNNATQMFLNESPPSRNLSECSQGESNPWVQSGYACSASSAPRPPCPLPDTQLPPTSARPPHPTSHSFLLQCLDSPRLALPSTAHSPSRH
ncbi:hypothetical protein E2C01_078035 [Portunus trituberculatus]|uniref:Uncharacterized protein n=1 Tax=Portunus trituberculatus TaxID=210409 RepID=A0A5B7INY9_PORTR|nr:hypothetical protein [Portunus trituberculatus]